jgi:hypothetical protein
MPLIRLDTALLIRSVGAMVSPVGNCRGSGTPKRTPCCVQLSGGFLLETVGVCSSRVLSSHDARRDW